MKKTLNVIKFNRKKFKGGRLNEVKQPKINNKKKSNLKYFFNLFQ